MYNYTPDEVTQVAIDDLRTELKELKATKCKSEFKDIHEMNFKLGKCYEFRIRDSENRNAIFLERRGDALFFVTAGSGRIAAVKEERFMYNKYYTKNYNIYEDSLIDNASIMVVDLDLIFDSCVYARELI